MVGEEEDNGVRKRVRKSRDMKVNSEGRRLVEFMEERRWGIFNGCGKGDEEGEFTFTGGRENTVIDYAIGEEEVRERIREFKVGDRIESDHQPLELRIEGEVRMGRGGGKRKGKGIRRWKGVWSEDGRKDFVERLGEIRVGGKV